MSRSEKIDETRNTIKHISDAELAAALHGYAQRLFARDTIGQQETDIMATILEESASRLTPNASEAGKETSAPIQEQEETHTERVGWAFGQSVIAGRYCVFQLVDHDIHGHSARGLNPDDVIRDWDYRWRNMKDFIMVKTGVDTPMDLEKRSHELAEMQTDSRRETGTTAPLVGNSVVVIIETRNGTKLLVVYGVLSAETEGSWTGGRTLPVDYILFEVRNDETINTFLQAIDVNARAYDAGTETNYAVIVEAMKGAFSPVTLRYVSSHMFRRQEFLKVVDLREAKG